MMDGFRDYWASAMADATIGLRATAAADAALLADLYYSTRADELARAPWTPAQARAFSDWQSSEQERHYDAHYPGFERLVIIDRRPARAAGNIDDDRIGRLYVMTTTAEVRLMDITLLPHC